MVEKWRCSENMESHAWIYELFSFKKLFLNEMLFYFTLFWVGVDVNYNIESIINTILKIMYGVRWVWDL